MSVEQCMCIIRLQTSYIRLRDVHRSTFEVRTEISSTVQSFTKGYRCGNNLIEVSDFFRLGWQKRLYEYILLDTASIVMCSKLRPSMNNGCRGSRSLASCFAIPLCNLPWKSIPTSRPSARTSRTRATVSSNSAGESIQSIASSDHIKIGTGESEIT